MKNKNWWMWLVLALIILLGIWLYRAYPMQSSAVDNQQAAEENQSQTADNNANAQNDTAAKDSLAGTAWVLNAATVDAKLVDMDVNIAQPMTLNFDAASGKYSGFAGCNSFSGSYSVMTGNKFSFGATAATKKYCPVSSAMEAQVLSAMGKVGKFSMSGGKLMFQSGDGKTQLTYQQAV